MESMHIINMDFVSVYFNKIEPNADACEDLILGRTSYDVGSVEGDPVSPFVKANKESPCFFCL